VAEPILCAVIVARNEDPYIARCIEAVLEVASSFQGCQVALVDSRSSDRTVDIARQYPITVVRVRDGIRCTAALSRLIGQGLTAGGAILFVDGDTTINPQWVQAAVSLLDEQPDVAGVGGKLREVYYRNGLPISENEDFFRMGSTIEDAYQLGGNAIYRRAALDAVGSFNPWVVSHEEAELAERLRRAGYRLVRIPVTVGTHHTGPRDAWGECLQRFRSGLMVGYGQVLRLSLNTPLFWEHARQLNRYVLWLGFLAFGVAAAISSAITGNGLYLVSWTALAAMIVGILVARAGGVRMPLAVLAEWTLAAPAIVWGFVQRPAAASNLAPDQAVEILSERRAAPTAGALGAAL
jgi:cellulose synthase/poly-beta-1,6-N-acetylglucosamine synthase-like glycosyltransferase